jgi:hypothetical protein
MSQPVPHPVDLGFSVADGEKLKVSYESQALRISFVDWQEKPVVFLCRDTIAFRWQEAEYLLSDQERDDSCYEIIGSTWLRQHEEQHMTWEGPTFHHYKLNFNAAGILESIFPELRGLPSQTLHPTAARPRSQAWSWRA